VSVSTCVFLGLGLQALPALHLPLCTHRHLVLQHLLAGNGQEQGEPSAGGAGDELDQALVLTCSLLGFLSSQMQILVHSAVPRVAQAGGYGAEFYRRRHWRVCHSEQGYKELQDHSPLPQHSDILQH
jgi:hypothetical protein